MGPGEGGGAVGKFSLQLFVHELVQEFAHGGTWFCAELLQIVAGEERFGLNFLLRKLVQLSREKCVYIELAVAGGAVDAVQLQLFHKGGAGEESFESADSHVGSVFEGHMVGDTSGDGGDFVIGVAEATQDFLGHAGSDSFMPKKADSTTGFCF